MTAQMMIRVDPETKEKFNKLARIEGKTTSQMMRELMQDYIKDRDISVSIDDLWDRIGTKLQAKQASLKDINGAIKKARRKQ